MATEIRVPTLGESVTEATVATWFKKPGDSVAADEMLCELETDKVTVEVPSPTSGKLDEIVAKEGETVGVDALLGMIAEAGQAGSSTEVTERKTAEASKPDSEAEADVSQDTAKEKPDAKADEKPDAKPDDEGQSVDVMVPALGESVSEATVSTWFKKSGDTVAQDEMLCELETDKVSVEVPAPAAGVLREILAKEGETVEAGGKLAVMTRGGKGQSHSVEEGTPETTADPGARDGTATSAKSASKDVEDAPSAKKMMAEHNLSADDVTGSGKDGRIMKEDVQKALQAPKAPEAPAPSQAPRAPVAAEDAGREERVKMTRLRQT
ncbi:MAG: dihydrolipoamide succinyltransferase, partial [Rhodobacteraceae bacterium]